MTKHKRASPVTDWIKCPTCGGRNYYHKKQTKRYRCRKDGTEFVLDEKRQTTRRVSD